MSQSLHSVAWIDSRPAGRVLLRTQSVQRRRRATPGAAARQVPASAEYVYYAVIANAIFGVVSIRFAAAAVLILLAAFCLKRAGAARRLVWPRVWSPLACAGAFLALQLVFHGESLLNAYNRAFVTWIPAVIVAQCLAMREGFLRRYVIVSGIIGVLLLPYLDLQYEVTSTYTRAGLDTSIGLNNSNALAAWFGFCCVYVFVLAVETRRMGARLLSLTAVAACLVIVGLTVSRGTLAAIVVCCAIPLLRTMKRRVVPLLVLAAFAGVTVWMGLFDQAMGSYAARGSEETGRLLTWPVVVERFLGAPLTGIGVSGAEIFVSTKGDIVTPHNGLLFIALTSGIVPLSFFAMYWWKAARGAVRALRTGAHDGPFIVPLLLYSFFVMSLTNQAFTSDWIIVTLAVALGAPRTFRRVPQRQRVVPVGTRGRLVRAHAAPGPY